jgi:hypothetical protein
MTGSSCLGMAGQHLPRNFGTPLRRIAITCQVIDESDKGDWTLTFGKSIMPQKEHF